MEVKKLSCLFIPLSENSSESIKMYLTRVFRDYHSGESSTYQFYKEDSNYLLVPRYFPLNKFGNYEIDDRSNPGQDIEINSKIELRNEIQKQTVNYMMKNNNGIIQLSPGSGKTIISIHMICERKKKTLVVTHRTSLVEQWRDRFLQFTDLREEDVCIFKTSKVDECLSKPIIISTVQSLLSFFNRKQMEAVRKFWSSGIGISISDEVHTTTGAQRFSECSLYIPSRVNFGLSATPQRRDGTDDIMRYHLGEVYHPVGLSGTMDAKVICILCDLEIKKNMYVYWGGRFQKTRYLNKLSKSDYFIDLSLQLLNKYCVDREILFVSERIKLIETLFDKTECSDKSKFIENAKNEELDHKLTFATVGKVRDGTDAPKKDLLIMSSPVGNIEQLVGRIVRTYPGKKDPIVIDIIDITHQDISRTLHKRLKYYDSKNWKIKFLFVDNNRMSKNITREEALEMIE